MRGVVLSLGTSVWCVALCNVGYLSTHVCVVALKASVCVCVCVKYSGKISHVVRDWMRSRRTEPL